VSAARFEPSGPLRGDYSPPPDKSISHRAALFGAMCREPVAVRNYLDSADTRSTLDALLALGVGVEERGRPGATEEVVMRGVGLRAGLDPTAGHVDVGNSGTLLRLLPGWLAGQPGGRWTLEGDESIRRRPVDRVVEPLARMGAEIEARDGRFPPLTVTGADLCGIDYAMPVASAQVKSCVLIAGLLASRTTRLTERRPSRDHTERILRRSGVPFEHDGPAVSVAGVQELELDEIAVPGDPSSAAFVVTAACLVPGSRVAVSRLGLNWTRTAFFRIAKRMGAVIVGELEEPGTLADAEPMGDLDVAHGPLTGTEVAPDEVPLAIDELTLVALLGAFAEGETVVQGAGELRHKESDRIAGVVEGLSALGADIEDRGDGFAVRGDGAPLGGGGLDARGDHRLAMLGAVAGLASSGGVEVVGMDATAVSYPDFQQDLGALLGSGATSRRRGV
jgi:3-phosphoshikimate 1-carboxyvinyltransferase